MVDSAAHGYPPESTPFSAAIVIHECLDVKVLFVVRSLEVGGAEHQLVTLAKGLRDAGHHPAVAVFYPGGAFEAVLRDANIPVHSLEKSGRWDLAFMSRLVGLVRGLKPDVVHSYLGTSNKIVAALRPFLGRAGVVWGVRSAFVDLPRYDWVTRLGYRIEPWFSALADAIIVNSNSAAAHARKSGFRHSGLVVIPNGIDCAHFQRDEPSRLAWRHRWRVDPDTPVVGIVGRLDPMKDHPTFLRAAGLVAPHAPQAMFACVGDGVPACRRQLEAMAKQLGLEGRIRWEQGTRDVRGVYSALDLLVLSSSGESFPNVLAEAMACSTPCITTDVGDAAHILGDTGIVVPPSDPAMLASAIQQALAWDALERSCRGDAARARVAAQFSISALVQNTVTVLERVAHSRRRSTS